MTDKPPSERQLIAQRIATFIIENHLNNPFGGDVHQDSAKGKPYCVDFAVPALLDGVVAIYGPKFIQFRMRGRLGHGDGSVFESEKNALDFLRLLLVEHKIEEALDIPTKAPRSES